jgi:hypothetical protein
VYIIPIDSVLNGLLSVLSLSELVKTAVSAGVPTLEDLEDFFLNLADDEAKGRAILEHILDESIVTHHDILRIMFFSVVHVEHCGSRFSMVQLHSIFLCGPQASRWTRQAGIFRHGPW